MFNWSRNPDNRYLSTFFDRNSQSPQQRMEMLDLYYSCNDLYENEAQMAYWRNEWLEAIKPLRTPVHRSVDFYAAKLCQGSPNVQVSSKNQATMDAVDAILKNSNFMGQKSGMLRKNALYGNTFLKSVFNGEKVYFTKLDAKNVTDFEEDERGYLKWIRIDVKMPDGQWYTEYWTMDGSGYVAIYNHRFTKDTPVDQLGIPTETHFLEEYGIDYIPIIHAKFVDADDKWGKSCVDHVIVKIDELNREVTNLVELMFQNKAYWAVTTGVDKDGISIPTPEWENLSDDDAFKMGLSKTAILKFPGADAKLSIPDFSWNEFLAITKDAIEDIERDLPELRYYNLRESDLSGVAIKTMLAGAIDKANEAQDNFVEALIKSIKICLSMGKFFGLFPSSIGNYDAGDFDMEIEFEEIIPAASNQEQANVLQTLTSAGIPLPVAMRKAGFSEDEISEAVSLLRPASPVTN